MPHLRYDATYPAASTTSPNPALALTLSFHPPGVREEAPITEASVSVGVGMSSVGMGVTVVGFGVLGRRTLRGRSARLVAPESRGDY